MSASVGIASYAFLLAARLVGMQALNVFGKLYRQQAEQLDEAHLREASEAVASYTFQSATQSPRRAGADGAADGAAATLAAFAPFRRQYLQPLLLRVPRRLGRSGVPRQQY